MFGIRRSVRRVFYRLSYQKPLCTRVINQLYHLIVEQLLFLFLTFFSVLVANSLKLLNTVVNPACCLLNREKRKVKVKVWQLEWKKNNNKRTRGANNKDVQKKRWSERHHLLKHPRQREGLRVLRILFKGCILVSSVASWGNTNNVTITQGTRQETTDYKRDLPYVVI